MKLINQLIFFFFYLKKTEIYHHDYLMQNQEFQMHFQYSQHVIHMVKIRHYY